MITSFTINKIVNKHELDYQIAKFSQVLNINYHEYSNLYFIINELNDHRKAITLSCYDDGLELKLLFLEDKKILLGYNQNIHFINWDTLREIKKIIMPFTIFDIQYLDKLVLVIHEFGIHLYSTELTELSSHNRNIPLEDFCVDNKITVKFENESEYFLDCVTLKEIG